MQAKVSVSVTDANGAITRVSLTVDGSNPYGQNPVLGAISNGLEESRKIVAEALKPAR